MTSGITVETTSLERHLRALFVAPEEGRRRIAVIAAIPDTVLDVRVAFYWQDAALYALTSPVREVPAAALAAALDVPFWCDRDRLVAVSARGVLARPDRYPEHRVRIEAVDTAYPIALSGDGRRAVVPDGYHRLANAALRGRSTLSARIMIDEDLPGILVRDGFLGELKRLWADTPALITLARTVAWDRLDRQSFGRRGGRGRAAPSVSSGCRGMTVCGRSSLDERRTPPTGAAHKGRLYAAILPHGAYPGGCARSTPQGRAWPARNRVPTPATEGRGYQRQRRPSSDRRGRHPSRTSPA